MPEGHTLHRLARRHLQTFGGATVHVTSPQGRFAAGAALLDGRRCCAPPRPTASISSSGSRLRSGGAPTAGCTCTWACYGTWDFGTGEPPPPAKGALRLRIGERRGVGGPARADRLRADHRHRGRAGIRARLGPDPLREDADPAARSARIRRSSRADRRAAHAAGRRVGDRQRLPGGGAVPAPARSVDAGPRPGRAAVGGAVGRPRRAAARRAAAGADRDDPAEGPPAPVRARPRGASSTTSTAGPTCPVFSAARRWSPSRWPAARLYRCPWCQARGRASAADLAADLADADSDDLTPEQGVALEAARSPSRRTGRPARRTPRRRRRPRRRGAR